MLDVLNKRFPPEISVNIMVYVSHPVADLLRDLIAEWKYFKPFSEGQLLEFRHYMANKLMIDGNYQIERWGFIEMHLSKTEQLTYVPWGIRFPDGYPNDSD